MTEKTTMIIAAQQRWRSELKGKMAGKVVGERSKPADAFSWETVELFLTGRGFNKPRRGKRQFTFLVQFGKCYYMKGRASAGVCWGAYVRSQLRVHA